MSAAAAAAVALNTARARPTDDVSTTRHGTFHRSAHGTAPDADRPAGQIITLWTDIREMASVRRDATGNSTRHEE